jgi:hypothetical protein
LRRCGGELRNPGTPTRASDYGGGANARRRPQLASPSSGADISLRPCFNSAQTTLDLERMDAAIDPGTSVDDDMVWLPGGTFRMGSDHHDPKEPPAHDVSVDGFRIDRTPVTNRQRFVEATVKGGASPLPPAAVAGAST